MGKTTPTYRDTMHDALEPYDTQYRRALRRDRQAAYDALRDDLEELTMAMGAANAPDVWTPIHLSLAVVLAERLDELEARVTALEAALDS